MFTVKNNYCAEFVGLILRYITNSDWSEIAKRCGGFSDDLEAYSVSILREDLLKERFFDTNRCRDILWVISESQWNINELTSPYSRLLLSSLYLYCERKLCSTNVNSEFAIFALESLLESNIEISAYLNFLESLYESSSSSCIDSDFFILSSWYVCVNMISMIDKDKKISAVEDILTTILTTIDSVVELTVAEDGFGAWVSFIQKLPHQDKYLRLLNRSQV